MENSVMQKRIETFKAFGETLKCAKVYFREDWEVLYFDLQGKMFGMMSDQASEDAIITLKNLPEKNEELREIYAGTGSPATIRIKIIGIRSSWPVRNCRMRPSSN
ncbi:hypothetical protein G15_3564 [Enterococcus avium]|nr:hypothetical protein G15_3564 [Enterococcus avium]